MKLDRAVESFAEILLDFFSLLGALFLITAAAELFKGNDPS